MWILSALLFVQAAPQLTAIQAPGYKTPVPGVWYTAGEAMSAMPLGALGAGFIELSSAGTFGNVACENNWTKPVPCLPESGLEVRVGKKTVRLFPKEEPCSSIRFWGHFPMADLDFRDTFKPVDVLVRAFAPLLPNDYDLSSMPAALFHVTVYNRGHTSVDASICLQWQANGEKAWAVIPFFNGIQLGGTEGSYAISAQGDARWKVLTDAPADNLLRTDATCTIMPGETVEITLALAWHFPTWKSSDDEILKHRYAATLKDAQAAAETVLPRARDIEERIIQWQSSIYASPVPDLLKDAVINGLYILARNSWWLDDGRFFQSESFTGCPITETFVCRYYGSFPLAVFWPDCERATMRTIAKAQADSGEIPFGFGSPMGSRSPMFHVQHPIVSPEFVLTTWRNFSLWKDEAYLKEMYPAVRRALRFAMTLDKDQDGLIDEDPGNEKGFPANQYYDIWPWWGVSAYTGGIWLAALRAGEECAKQQGEAAFADELRGWRERGAKSYEEKLWTGQYYRLYNDVAKSRLSDTSLANALCGQWFAYAAGLGEFLPHEHICGVMDTVLKRNVAATPFGAVNGATPDGKPDETFPDHSAVITIGEVWNFCAMMAFAGRKEDAVTLFNRSYGNILLRQATPWNIPWSLDRDTGAIKWGVHYYSNPCVWTLFQALDPEGYKKLGKY